MNFLNNKDFKPRFFLSHTTLLCVMLIIFAISLINTNNSSAEGVTGKDMAKHWAPVIYQKVDITGGHSLGGHADFITNFDFDGDECGDNNWDNAKILKDNSFK